MALTCCSKLMSVLLFVLCAHWHVVLCSLGNDPPHSECIKMVELPSMLRSEHHAYHCKPQTMYTAMSNMICQTGHLSCYITTDCCREAENGRQVNLVALYCPGAAVCHLPPGIHVHLDPGTPPSTHGQPTHPSTPNPACQSTTAGHSQLMGRRCWQCWRLRPAAALGRACCCYTGPS